MPDDDIPGTDPVAVPTTPAGAPNMAYSTNEQVTLGSEVKGVTRRVIAKLIQAKTLAAGAGTILALTPMTFNTETEKWQIWSGKHNEIDTITPSGTVSGGNWTITVEGETTANIAHTANAATIQAALEKLGNIDKGDVTVTGGPLSATGPVVPVVLTFDGQYRHKKITVTIDASGLTGGGTAALAQTQAGVNTSGIQGFLWPDPVTLAAANEVLCQMLLEGEINYAEILLPAGESEAALKVALNTGEVRKRGLIIQGLPKFH
jgi:hypothetical protein